MELPQAMNIDLVEREGFHIFMYRDDFRYPEIPDHQKRLARLSMGTLMKQSPPKPIDPSEWARHWAWGHDATSRLLAHFVRHMPEFRLIDIGCKYGITSLRWRRLLGSFGCNPAIHAFDCGAAGILAAYNIANNGGGVDFHPWAVGDWNGYGLVFSEPGHPENNRIVNQAQDPWSTIVRTVTLDAFLADKPGPLVLKIDTQGAEPEVMAGFRRDRLFAAFLEFTPHALVTRVDPADWLRQFMDTHLVFEFAPYQPAIVEITPETAQAYAAHVSARPANWTDVILLPKELPALDEIAGQLRGFRHSLGDPAAHKYRSAESNAVAMP